MRRVFAILMICSSLFYISCEDEHIEQISNCEYGAELHERFKGSAMQILLHNMINDPTHSDYYNSEFNQDSIDYILSKLQAISDLTVDDSLFNIYHYTYPIQYSTKCIRVFVDSETIEAQSLINNEISGDTEFDLLVENLDLVNYFTYDNQIEFLFESENHINFSAMLSQLNELTFVNWVGINTGAGFMNIGPAQEIQFYHLPNNVSRLTFELVFYDCVLGRGIFGRWIYEVDENCKAVLVEA